MTSARPAANNMLCILMGKWTPARTEMIPNPNRQSTSRSHQMKLAQRRSFGAGRAPAKPEHSSMSLLPIAIEGDANYSSSKKRSPLFYLSQEQKQALAIIALGTAKRPSPFGLVKADSCRFRNCLQNDFLKADSVPLCRHDTVSSDSSKGESPSCAINFRSGECRI